MGEWGERSHRFQEPLLLHLLVKLHEQRGEHLGHVRVCGQALASHAPGPKEKAPWGDEGGEVDVNVNVNELRLGFSNTTRNPEGMPLQQLQRCCKN